MTNQKTCSRCRKEKNIDEFRGENRQCNYCCDMRQQYRQNHPEKEKQWYETTVLNLGKNCGNKRKNT